MEEKKKEWVELEREKTLSRLRSFREVITHNPLCSFNHPLSVCVCVCVIFIQLRFLVSFLTVYLCVFVYACM